MPAVALPTLHCYRCVYSWTPAKSPVRMCPRCKSKKFNIAEVRRPPYEGGGLGIDAIVTPKRSEILALVEKHGFVNPRVFGSVVRGEATAKSDLDLLVAYGPKAGLLDQTRLRMALEALIGRKVDVVPEDGLRWYAAPEIQAQAVPL